MDNCSRVVAKLRRKVPEVSYHRILAVWTGTQEDALSDPDVRVCLEYLNIFFNVVEEDVVALVDLGTCLLDYAFTRQGLDDKFVRVTKPAELQEAEPPSSNLSNFEKHLESIPSHIFVVAVKKALYLWKPRLVVDIVKLHPDTVYRITMTHDGHPVGDELVR